MLILPPEYVTIDGPLVFLAGPVQGAPDWQSRAVRWALATASTRHSTQHGSCTTARLRPRRIEITTSRSSWLVWMGRRQM